MAFKKGQGGRPPGASNKATKDLRDVLNRLAFRTPEGKVGKVDLHHQRLHELTQSKDEHVSLNALKLALAYRHAQPPQHLTIGSEADRPVMVRFVDAAGA